MTRSTFTPVVLAAAALAAGLGGCGAGGEGAGNAPSGGGGPSAARDAGIAFARCMRANGIDMPDPRTDENGVIGVEPGDDAGAGPDGTPPSRRFRSAERECRKHLKDLAPAPLSPEQAEEFRQESLAHAKCMREHGVNFPDPQFSEDGSAVVDIGPRSGIDPDSPVFQRAQQRCRQLQGGPGSAPGTGGGS